MISIDRWNARQVHLFTRYGRRRGTPLTPELVTVLGQRFALKHLRAAVVDGREHTLSTGGNMSTFRRYVPILTVGFAVLAGCRDEIPVPTGPDAIPASPSLETSPDDAQGLERPHEAQFQKISSQLPGFGGYYYDQEGNMVALLTDPDEEKQALELLYPILRERSLGEREKSTGQIVVEKAQYPYRQLSAWRDQASDRVLGVREVQYTDLDEARNRFVIGVSSEGAKEEAAKILSESRVPLEAVIFEETKPIEEMLSLQDFARPIEGGYQIQRADGGTCTLGFNAFYGGKATFLTNSHCTNSFWKLDGVNIFQNTVAAWKLVGTEAADPSSWGCGFLWIFNCRWSDAAVIQRAGGVAANHARIARTTFWATGLGNSGSLTVNPNNPRMTITGEYSFPVGGEMFDKMGRTTGWTYGFVTKTCVDVNKSGLRRVLCQDFIGQMHADFGDSGSPIFRWHGNTVTLAGLLWGGNGQEVVMSAMWNIEKDVGPLGTF